MALVSRHTWASRSVVAVVAALAVLQLWWSDLTGLGNVPPAGLTTATILFPLSLLSAALLARVSCFETRLGVVLACLAQLGLIVLALVVGLPGQDRHALDQQAVEALLLPVAGLALVEADRRARRARSTGDEESSPYAR